ncbi:MAG: glycine cleavage system protein GcvH [Chloroflexota bacterium]|nr:glycine cleavage system protein GcvH [Chloroflexota bacterium]
MAKVNNCDIPEELYYFVEKHIWLRPEPDGLITLGMTDVAQRLAGKVIVFTAKKPGRAIAKSQSVATIESSKWVGPVPSPINAEIVEANESLRGAPTLLNQDPYGAGWIVKLRAADWAADSADLVTGEQGVEAYRQALDAQGITCP